MQGQTQYHRPHTPATGAVSASSDIVNALLSLGYNDKEASWAAKQLPVDASVNDGIRQALKLLSKKNKFSFKNK